MISTDTGKIILGSWLRGEHLDDIRQVPVTDFGELADIAKTIRSGETDPIRVARASGASIGDIAEMMSGKYETLYQSAMSHVIESNRISWLKDHPDAKPAEIIKVVEGSQRAWMSGAPKPADLKDTISDYYDTLDERKQMKTILTGIKSLDDMTGGIFPGTLTAIGARPSTGKSAFVQQVAVNVAKAGAKVLFLTLEMTMAQIMDRMVLRYVNGIQQRELRSGELSEDQWQEISRVSDIISEMSGNLMYMQERDLRVIETLIKDVSPDLVVIDQLTQLGDSGMKFADRRAQFSHMTANLKRISMEQNCAIWLACQLNRAVNQTSKPTMDYLKESGSIEEDSDNVILLHRDEDEEQARGGLNGNRIISVDLAKHRSGETGQFDLEFIVQRFGFREIQEIPPGYYETQEEIDF